MDAAEQSNDDYSEQFWKTMETVMGRIPAMIKNIFELLGTPPGGWVAMLTSDGLRRLETFMRVEGVQLATEATQTNQKTLRDYFGVYHTNTANFAFNYFDETIILAMAEAVRNHGIDKFLTNTAVREDVQTSATINQQACAAITAKLNSYYENRRDSRYSANSFRNLRVRTVKGRGNKIIAFVLCIVCEKELKLVRDPPRSWTISNLTQHLCTHEPHTRTRQRRILNQANPRSCTTTTAQSVPDDMMSSPSQLELAGELSVQQAASSSEQYTAFPAEGGLPLLDFGCDLRPPLEGRAWDNVCQQAASVTEQNAADLVAECSMQQAASASKQNATFPVVGDLPLFDVVCDGDIQQAAPLTGQSVTAVPLDSSSMMNHGSGLSYYNIDQNTYFGDADECAEEVPSEN